MSNDVVISMIFYSSTSRQRKRERGYTVKREKERERGYTVKRGAIQMEKKGSEKENDW